MTYDVLHMHFSKKAFYRPFFHALHSIRRYMPHAFLFSTMAMGLKRSETTCCKQKTSKRHMEKKQL
ncbi:hypothetical protein EYI23_18385 [Bacillus subtilis]|nr:hypothetical protein CDO84_03565 [Bacillus sp. MD-5]NLS89899.1 hypothetical protein [Bacillus subtilis]